MSSMSPLVAITSVVLISLFAIPLAGILWKIFINLFKKK